MGIFFFETEKHIKMKAFSLLSIAFAEKHFGQGALTCYNGTGIFEQSPNAIYLKDHAHFQSKKCETPTAACSTWTTANSEAVVTVAASCNSDFLEFGDSGNDSCECTNQGGYVCYHSCDGDNCNMLVDTHRSMQERCNFQNDQTYASGNGENGEGEGESAGSAPIAAVFVALTALFV